MVECIHFRPELRYTQEELAAHLPKVENEPAAPAVANLKGTRQGLSLVLKRCAFMGHCREDAAALSEHDWYSMITNLAVFEGGMNCFAARMASTGAEKTSAPDNASRSSSSAMGW